MSKNCDRCGKPVPEEDNILNVDALILNTLGDGFVYGGAPVSFVYGFAPRHIACSPSRAQYICVEPYGQPDERAEYDKRILVQKGYGELVETMERRWTDAYRKHLDELNSTDIWEPASYWRDLY